MHSHAPRSAAWAVGASTLLFLSHAAHAQRSVPATRHAPSTAASAAPALTTIPPAATATATATTSPPTTPDDPRLTEARERQRRGRALLDGRDFNGALAEFERVYQLLDGHPRRYMALSNIGRAYQSLAQYDRAIDYYQRYLREAPPDAEDRATVDAAIHALDDLLGSLQITIDGPARAEVWADNRMLGEAPGSIRLPTGRHLIELRAAGYQPVRREVQLSAHDTVPLRFRLERPRGGIAPAVFATGVGVTVATLGAGGISGIVALSARGAIDARRMNPNPEERFLVAGEAADRAAVGTPATIADVLFIAGGALAIGTTVLALVTDWRGRGGGTERPPARTGWLVVPIGRGAAALVGSF